MPAESTERGAARAAAARASVETAEPTPGSYKPNPILKVDRLTRRFGGLTAVDVEHLEVEEGIITAFIGPNGAGKTTLFNLITGFDPPDEGQWSFKGQELGGRPPHEISRSGMVRTFQLTKSLAKMSVIDNMLLGARDQTGESIFKALLRGSWRSQERHNIERAEELLTRFNLIHMRDEYAATMSGGQRKLLEMARALMAEPDLILLDEPMAGVNPALVQSLLGHIEALREDGVSVLFIEHDMDVIMGISDWVVVLAEGRIIAEGTPADVSQNVTVIDAYLGTSFADEIDDAAASEGADHG